MKIIYSILFASFSLLSWTSCSSYLEENPKDRLDEETAYSTLSDVQKNGVLSLYNYVGGYVDSQGLQGTLLTKVVFNHKNTAGLLTYDPIHHGKSRLLGKLQWIGLSYVKHSNGLIRRLHRWSMHLICFRLWDIFWCHVSKEGI